MCLRLGGSWRGGTCWGGLEGGSGASDRDLCIAPAYFSPGQWRLFAKYLLRHAELMPRELGYSAAELNKHGYSVADLVEGEYPIAELRATA